MSARELPRRRAETAVWGRRGARCCLHCVTAQLRRGAHAAPAQPVDKAQLCLHPARGSPVEPTFDKRSPPLTARLQLTDRSSPTRWPCCSSCPPSRPRAASCSCPPSFPLDAAPSSTAARRRRRRPRPRRHRRDLLLLQRHRPRRPTPPGRPSRARAASYRAPGRLALTAFARSPRPSARQILIPWSTASVSAAISKSPSAASARATASAAPLTTSTTA